jgi:branched-chain amino acid transport system substrate-binding protein
LARRRWVAALLLPLLIAACGTTEGVSSGATVTVYLSAPMRGPEGGVGKQLCASAKSTLSQADGKAGDLNVRLRCLDASGPTSAWTLATVGANARRAVEDSTTVAYIAEPDPQARHQSRPILEEADIAAVTGGDSMQRILSAIEDAGGGSLREQLSEALG